MARHEDIESWEKWVQHSSCTSSTRAGKDKSVDWLVMHKKETGFQISPCTHSSAGAGLAASSDKARGCNLGTCRLAFTQQERTWVAVGGVLVSRALAMQHTGRHK